MQLKNMKCTILGCGGSNGVPQIACSCYVCSSNDSRNKRSRSSILIESPKATLLVDTSPDLHAQALKNNIITLDGVIYTHCHFDHVGGIDDIRQLVLGKQPIPGFMDPVTAKIMNMRFDYIFSQLTKHYKPLLNLNIFHGSFSFHDIEIHPFLQRHGNYFSYGFRFGQLAYSTDVTLLDEEAFNILAGVKIWVVDCLRYHHAPTHANLEMTLGWIERVKPEQAILTHMGHEIDYSEIKRLLPSNVIPAYDGMLIQFNG